MQWFRMKDKSTIGESKSLDEVLQRYGRYTYNGTFSNSSLALITVVKQLGSD